MFSKLLSACIFATFSFSVPFPFGNLAHVMCGDQTGHNMGNDKLVMYISGSCADVEWVLVERVAVSVRELEVPELTRNADDASSGVYNCRYMLAKV
jgi:hypothetical protein